jgi:hypothetical protein
LLGRQAVPPAPVDPARTVSLEEAAAPALAAALRAVEMEYAASYKGFMPLQTQASVMGLEHTQGLRESWETMQNTERALKAALAEHPDNLFLGAKLLTLRAQQLEFMRHLHMLDQNSWRNI